LSFFYSIHSLFKKLNLGAGFARLKILGLFKIPIKHKRGVPAYFSGPVGW